MENEKKVCVTGGSGFLASWLIFKLLQNGYSVNTTIRPSSGISGQKKDVKYLTNLPNATEKLHIFTADLSNPESFEPAIEGCIGLFHVAYPMNLNNVESEEENTKKSVNGTLGILKICLNSKTVKKIVYTSSISAVMFDESGRDILDERSWSNVDLIRKINGLMSVYNITKTLTEKACLEFAEKHGLDLVTILPPLIHGPFITPNVPDSVYASMAFFFGKAKMILAKIPLVHTDDVVRAHIFLFENNDAKGRYICYPLEITVEKLHKFLSTRYPDLRIGPLIGSEEGAETKLPTMSSQKLLDIGFEFKYGLEEMYDDSISCCKERGVL